MAVCQVEGTGRFGITSLLQAVKKLRPHHKFDIFLYFRNFLLFCDVKFPQIHVSATFPDMSLIKIKCPGTYRRVFHPHSQKRARMSPVFPVASRFRNTASDEALPCPF
jgi:hypothetical protein